MEKKKFYISFLLLVIVAIFLSIGGVVFYFPGSSVFWKNVLVHVLIEGFEGFAALSLSCFLMFRPQEKPEDRCLAPLAIGFLGMGLFELLHAVTPIEENLFVFFKMAAFFFGGLGFAFLAFFPIKKERIKNNFGWVFLFSLIIFLGFGLCLFFFSDILPKSLLSRPFIDILSCISAFMFFVGSADFLLKFYRTGERQDYLFSSMATLLGISCFFILRSEALSGSSWFWHLVLLFSMCIGLVFLFYKYFDTLTSLLKTQRTLENSRQACELFYNAVPDVFYFFDEQKKVLLWNQALRRVSGFSNEEISKKKATDFFSQEDQSSIETFCSTILQEGSGREEVDFVTKDGVHIPYEFVGTLLPNPNGGVRGIFNVGRDISERKKFEEKLEENVKAKLEFMNMVSHELRTPLSVLKESIAILEEKMTKSRDEEQKNLLHLAKNSIDRLSRLINNVLDFQKMLSGKMAYDRQMHDLNTLVKEAGQSVLPMVNKKGLKLDIQVEDSLPEIVMDTDKINEVLFNLLDNALKFTEKGTLTIRTKKEGSVVHISVQDTGRGIQKEELEKLFHKFEQVRKKSGGTGLGLAICKQIVEAHGGTIWAESEWGKGTTMHFILPIEGNKVTLGTS
jgi:PAS domain S-box-containing protein